MRWLARWVAVWGGGGEAFEGFDGGFLDLRDVPMDPLAYVIPGPAQNGHAAWYSETHQMGAGARIVQGCVHLGWRDGARFTHTHGIWEDAAARGIWGISCPIRPWSRAIAPLRAGGCRAAALWRSPTRKRGLPCFSQSRARTRWWRPAHLVTLRPNQDIGAALSGLSGRVMGLGSLIGTQMEDGAALDSYATEILLTNGHVGPTGARLDAASIGLDGRMVEGRWRPA